MNVALHEIRMPDLGDVAKAVVVQWLQPVGAQVQEGDDLLEVETEKTTFVIPAPLSGCLTRIYSPETTGVSTGDALGAIEPA